MLLASSHIRFRLGIWEVESEKAELLRRTASLPGEGKGKQGLVKPRKLVSRWHWTVGGGGGVVESWSRRELGLLFGVEIRISRLFGIESDGLD